MWRCHVKASLAILYNVQRCSVSQVPHCTIAHIAKEACLQTCQDSSATQHARTPASSQDIQLPRGTLWRGKTQLPSRKHSPSCLRHRGSRTQVALSPACPGWAAGSPGDSLRERAGRRAKRAEACPEHRRGPRGFASFASVL